MSTTYYCLVCKHITGAQTCQAFPDKIPTDIMTGKKSHNEVLAGQEGDFIFKPSKGNGEKLADLMGYKTPGDEDEGGVLIT